MKLKQARLFFTGTLTYHISHHLPTRDCQHSTAGSVYHGAKPYDSGHKDENGPDVLLDWLESYKAGSTMARAIAYAR